MALPPFKYIKHQCQNSSEKSKGPDKHLSIQKFNNLSHFHYPHKYTLASYDYIIINYYAIAIYKSE
jgi:hypothetical protein